MGSVLVICIIITITILFIHPPIHSFMFYRFIAFLSCGVICHQKFYFSISFYSYHILYPSSYLAYSDNTHLLTDPLHFSLYRNFQQAILLSIRHPYHRKRKMIIYSLLNMHEWTLCHWYRLELPDFLLRLSK